MADQSVTLQDVRDTLKFAETTDLTLLTTVTQTKPLEIMNYI